MLQKTKKIHGAQYPFKYCVRSVIDSFTLLTLERLGITGYLVQTTHSYPQPCRCGNLQWHENNYSSICEPLSQGKRAKEGEHIRRFELNCFLLYPTGYPKFIDTLSALYADNTINSFLLSPQL